MFGFQGLGVKSSSPSFSGLAFWGGLGRVGFLGLGFPKYSLKEGLLQFCWLGNDMFSAASWTALGESGSLQRAEVLECHSTFSRKFCHLLDWGLGPCLAQSVSRSSE